jgi:hypothetical protein
VNASHLIAIIGSMADNRALALNRRFELTGTDAEILRI